MKRANIRKNALGLVIGLFASGTQVFSADVLSLKDILGLVPNNHSIIAAQMKEKERREDRRASVSEFGPRVSFQSSYYKDDPNRTKSSPTEDTEDYRIRSNTDSKLVVQQNLFNSFVDVQGVAIKGMKYRQAKLETASMALDKSLDVLQVIEDIIAGQISIEALERKRLVQAQRQRELVRKAAARNISESDLMTISANIADTEASLLNEKTQLEANWRTVEQLLNHQFQMLGIYPIIVLEDDGMPASRKVPEIDLNRLPAILQKTVEMEIALAEKRQGVLALGPTLDVSYNRFLHRPEAKKNNKWDVQVTAAIGIPVNGQSLFQYREKSYGIDRIRAELEDKKTKTSTTIENYINSLKQENQRIEFLKESVAQYSRRSVNYLRQYNNGSQYLTDYLEALSEQINSEKTLATAKISYLIKAEKLRQYFSYQQ